MKKLVIALGAGALVATGLIAVAVQPSEHRASEVDATSSVAPKSAAHASVRTSDGVVKPRKLGEPCTPVRRSASISALHSTVPVWAPEGEHLEDAYLCGYLPTLWFGDVEVWYDDDAPAVPAAYFADQVARVGGRIQSVNGRMALVHPADADGPRNFVEVIAGKYSVTVLANPDVGIDRVLEVAQEIHIPESIGS